MENLLFLGVPILKHIRVHSGISVEFLEGRVNLGLTSNQHIGHTVVGSWFEVSSLRSKKLGFEPATLGLVV